MITAAILTLNLLLGSPAVLIGSHKSSLEVIHERIFIKIVCSVTYAELGDQEGSRLFLKEAIHLSDLANLTSDELKWLQRSAVREVVSTLPGARGSYESLMTAVKIITLNCNDNSI